MYLSLRVRPPWQARGEARASGVPLRSDERVPCFRRLPDSHLVSGHTDFGRCREAALVRVVEPMDSATQDTVASFVGQPI